MLSRVANSLYWLNRYIERAENYARFLDVNFNLSLELPPDLAEQWMPLIIATGDEELFNSFHKNPSKANVIKFLGFDSKNPSSVFNCILNARENARTVRPEITRELWEQVNTMYFIVKEAYGKKAWQKEDPRSFFNEIKKGCHQFYGILDATISRREGWHFSNMGRMIERADKTSRILDVKYNIILPSPDEIGTPIDIIHWAALLKSVSAYDMYRKEYGSLSSIEIVDFLILNKFFPRSIIRCIADAEDSIHIISGNNGSGYSNAVEKLAGMIRSRIEFSDIHDIFNSGLHEYLDEIQINLNDLSDEIFNMFFSKITNVSVDKSMAVLNE